MYVLVPGAYALTGQVMTIDYNGKYTEDEQKSKSGAERLVYSSLPYYAR